MADQQRRSTQLSLRTAAIALLVGGLLTGGFLAWNVVASELAGRRAQAAAVVNWYATVSSPARITPTDPETELRTASVDAPATPRARTRQNVDAAVVEAASGGDIAIGGAVALLAFERAGSASPPVLKKPIVVHHGTDAATLRRGPGQYRSSGPPGGPGIFAVAGHRTTYGAPFGRLDELVVGDLVHVTDRDGRQHTYRVVAQEVLEPSASWVLRDYPLGQGRPTLVLTTCHPRYSAAQRLVVFAELLATPPDQ